MIRFIVTVAVALLCNATVVAQSQSKVQQPTSEQTFGDEAVRKQVTRKGVDY